MSTLRLLMWLLAAVAAGTTAWFPTFAHAGTLDHMPAGTWAQELPESEMAELRGGFRGISFTAFATATIENMTTDLTGGTTTAPPPGFTVEGDLVGIQTLVGNYIGSGSLLQIANVNGSWNVVNNNLFVQIVVGDLPVNSPTLIGF